MTNSAVQLSRSLVEFPGFEHGLHERHRYGYSDVWQHFIAARAQRTAAPYSVHLPQSSSTILGDSPLASLKAPHMPLAFPVRSKLSFGVSSSPSLATQPTFSKRDDEPFFRPPDAPFSLMQALFSFQARPGAVPSALPPGRAMPSAPSGSHVFTTLSLASALASATVSASHAASSAFSQPALGLLPPPVGPGALMDPDRATRLYVYWAAL